MTGNPQKENGFTPIANELMDVFCQLNLTSREWQVFLFVLRKLYGWKKTADVIPLSQFVKGTHLDRKTICRSINSLVGKKLLDRSTNPRGTAYHFNKHYLSWKATSVGHATKASGISRPKLVSATPHSKETIKRKFKYCSIRI